MTISLYLASLDAFSGKSAIALGVMEQLTKQIGSVAIYRPVVRDEHTASGDPIISLLRQRYRLREEYSDCVGVTYSDVRSDSQAAMSLIVERYHRLAEKHEAVVIVGSDYTDVANMVEFSFNTQVAVNLASPMLLVVTGYQHTPADIDAALRFGVDEAEAAHATILGTVINRVDPELVETVAEAHPEADVVAESPSLDAPTVADLISASDGDILSGDDEVLSRVIADVVVAAMTLPNLLNRLSDGKAVILPGDRSEVLLGLLATHQAEGVPSLAAVFLTGGLRPPPQVLNIVNGMDSRLPIVQVEHDTFAMAVLAGGVRGTLVAGGDSKIATALEAFAADVDSTRLLSQMRVTTSDAVTPLMFEHRMLERARKADRHIVLPEGNDKRIIQAADRLLRRGVARLTLLGEESAIRQQAAELDADISEARIMHPADHEVRERFAHEYASLRAHKGITVDQARDVVTDVSYFGTMMVHTGMVDGMVSGAAHTTAQTIRPSFEIIKTKPGTSVVSSVFFMCLEDRVLVYGDCAVNPNPSAEELADIATSSAETAEMFGIESRVAMLSYSTGTSGHGAAVDKVRQATDLVRDSSPDIAIEGPIQYDAAADSSVAGTKLPESQVAGRATVFIVPDLNTGNNLYKAVQRSAGAIAVGPLMQGLRKPVNDLSRGATVTDIVNTVALTAIQAGEETQ